MTPRNLAGEDEDKVILRLDDCYPLNAKAPAGQMAHKLLYEIERTISE